MRYIIITVVLLLFAIGCQPTAVEHYEQHMQTCPECRDSTPMNPTMCREGLKLAVEALREEQEK